MRIVTKIYPLGPLQKISSKSVHNFFSYPTDRQISDRQTDRSENITSFGGGNNMITLDRVAQSSLIAARCVTVYDWKLVN